MKTIARSLMILSFLSLFVQPVSAVPHTRSVAVKKGTRTYKKSAFRKVYFIKKAPHRQRIIRNRRPIIKGTSAAASDLSNLRPSRNYNTNGNIDARVCQEEGIFDSYAQFLDCTDAAITSDCTSGDDSEKAFCIYQKCGNTPDNFEGLWRDLDSDSDSTGAQFYKNNFGSTAVGSDSFAVSLHPCLRDGAGRFESESAASTNVFGKVFGLAEARLNLFHPGKSENRNLSHGTARMTFGKDTLLIQRDDFGATTVPFSYKQEVFKRFPQTDEDADSVYWVDKVIPVYMVFRPQGVIGIEVDVRVSPESRVLEVNFAGYNDFGTSSAAGPARDGVIKNTSAGVISLIQSEFRTSKFISMNAEADSMLPSLSELSQLEYWPPKGSFDPICAQWFRSETTHPEYSYRCSTLVDFGPISQRQGAIFTARDGKDRIIMYRDRSEGGDDGTLKPFPYRDPILSDF